MVSGFLSIGSLALIDKDSKKLMLQAKLQGRQPLLPGYIDKSLAPPTDCIWKDRNGLNGTTADRKTDTDKLTSSHLISLKSFSAHGIVQGICGNRFILTGRSLKKS